MAGRRHTDIGAASGAQWLSERLGQPFVVENRPGAGTHAATEAVVRAPADGYTLLMATGSNAINATLYDKLNLQLHQRHRAGRGRPALSLCPGGTPSGSGQERLRTHRLCQGQSGQAQHGIVWHWQRQSPLGELFKMVSGVEMLHVPYRGSARCSSDLLSGQVQLAFDNLPASIGHIRAGKLRPLAVTTTIRSEALPDIPALGEILPGFEASAWIGVGAPKDTPAEIIGILNKEINAGLADPKSRLASPS